MGIWSLHWLEAAGTLRPWRSEIETKISGARNAVARVVEPSQLHVIIQRIPGLGMAEYGIGGHANRSSCFSITVDPDNPNFSVALAGQMICRSAVHEANHCMRMAGPGYGRTLGKALVSEGLAGHFTQSVLGTDPAPWDCAVGSEVLHRHFPSVEQLNDSKYLHHAWFFGRGGRYPRWLGYTLAYEIVREWRSKCSPANADLINTPASDILSAALPRFHGVRRSRPASNWRCYAWPDRWSSSAHDPG